MRIGDGRILHLKIRVGRGEVDFAKNLLKVLRRHARIGKREREFPLPFPFSFTKILQEEELGHA